jgi:hypothetical protein
MKTSIHNINPKRIFSRIWLIFKHQISRCCYEKVQTIHRSTVFLLCPVLQIFAQPADTATNITIVTATKSYEFIKGDGSNPVLIKAALSTTYRCNGFRTFVPFIENI